MKILIVTSEIGTSGGGLLLSCHRLVDELSKKHDVIWTDSTSTPVPCVLGEMAHFDGHSISKEYKLKLDSMRYADREIVIGFGARYNGYYASLLARNISARLILSLRGSDVNLAKWSVEDTYYLREACAYASHVVCLSKEMAHNVRMLCSFPEHKLCIIPNMMVGTPKNIVFPNLPSSLVIGCAAAHLNEKKGVVNLLHFVSALKKKSPLPVRLELVGMIDDDIALQYHSIVKDLFLQDSVRFIGYESRDQFESRLKTWDFYIQTSVCEGHPNSVMESLLCGTAVLMSPTGCIAEQLLADEHFRILVFRSWHADEMADQLLDIILRPDLSHLYNQVVSYLLASSSWSATYGKWLNLLEPKHELYHALSIEHITSVALHDVAGDEHDSITTPVAVFTSFVDFIAQSGYRLCSMRDYTLTDPESRAHCIVCTFDDGYAGLKSEALPVLRKYGFTATVFVCTELIGHDNKWNNKDAKLRHHLSKDDLLVLHHAGWEIASHGAQHKNLLKLTDPEIEYELETSANFLKNFVGYADTYSYPYGAFNRFIQLQVAKYYKYAFAVSEGGTTLTNDAYQIRRYSITDLYKMLAK